MYRDTWAEVNLNAIRDNMMKIRRLLPESVKLMAVVKADGYGHGAIASARMAEQAGAGVLAVAYLEEALKLRAGGSKLPILILTPIHPQDVRIALENDLMLTVTRAEWFREMRAYKPKLKAKKLIVHVKMDTGLGRIGIQTKEEWDELVPWLQAKDIVVDGVYTHFATAGRADTTFLEQQYKQFLIMMEWSKQSPITVNSYHCAGSAAALRFPELAMDMVRIGAAMYGFYPKQLVDHIKLEPALSLYSHIMQVKLLRKGQSIGYDNSYTADEDQWIGTIPIGYADGWSQSLQGSQMIVNGQRAIVVGKICMDQLMIKLPTYCKAGELVTLIGRQGEEEMTLTELAAHIGTVPQEISTSISSRVNKISREQGEKQLRWDKPIQQTKWTNVGI